MSLTIIALSGRARSGKDTAANMLMELVDLPITRIAYADTLKQEVATKLDISLELLDIFKNSTKTLEVNKVTYNIRKLLQSTADDNRKIDASYYSKRLLNKIPKEGTVIITDMRYLLEYNELKKKYPNTMFIKLIRDGITIKDSNHSSETEVDSIPINTVIHNDGTIADLKNKIIKLITNNIKTKGVSVKEVDSIFDKYDTASFISKIFKSCYHRRDVTSMHIKCRGLVNHLYDKLNGNKVTIGMLNDEITTIENGNAALSTNINELEAEVLSYKKEIANLTKENMASSITIKKLTKQVDTANKKYNKKLTDKKVLKIVDLSNSGVSTIDIGKQMGVSKSTVSRIMSGKLHAKITGINK